MSTASTRGQINNALGFIFVNTEFLFQFLWCKTEVIVINKVIFTGIIWRININTLHLPCIRLQQVFQRIQVVTTDIDILTILVLWLAVVFQIRLYHRCRINRGYQVCIVLT